MKNVDIIHSSIDNVQKLVFKNEENYVFEVSFIRKGDGKDILCVPTQTSCRMGCKFCHLTGLDVPVKNISAPEIAELVSSSLSIIGVHNKTLLISYMGAGEPLMNVDGVIGSAKLIKKFSYYQNVRFGLATLIPGIKPFNEFVQEVSKESLPFKVHWSLHFTNRSTRKSLMPAALDAELGIKLLTEYVNKTNCPAEIHYTLIDNLNDQEEDVSYLDKMIQDKRISIKLLRFAPKDSEPSLTESKNVDNFKTALQSKGFIVEVYSPPGRDIGSSCGQFILEQYTV
jgi:adenine C2-methylase RlmN of 23S rRNA A2503 and tRNA A37